MPSPAAKLPPPSSAKPDAAPRPVIKARGCSPVVKGSIELRPLTVFAGPSNAAKSQLATLVYGRAKCRRVPATGQQLGPGECAYYLPAERGGMMRFHSVLADALLQQDAAAALRLQNPALSGVHGDFLQQLAGIAAVDCPRKPDPAMNALAESVEKKFLQGKLVCKQAAKGSPGLMFQPAWDKAQPLPLPSAPPAVTALAPVVLFLRHLVRPGDTLIIEEPEAHLYPAAQWGIIHQVALWVRAGVNALITTQCDWTMEALSSMVLRGELREKPKNRPIHLDKKDVGIWLFDYLDPKDPGKGSKVVEEPLNMQQGGYLSAFGDVAADSHNDLARTLDRLSDEGQI